jgi:hypothetical protein
LGFLRPEDLILLVTRAPMDDLRLGDNKAIRRSDTELEERLFKALHRWFETCGRSQVELTDAAAAISPEIAERQCMMFFQNGGASYKNYGPRGCYDKDRKYFENRHRLTPAFLVYEEHAWPGGPGLQAAFGMGGPETLAWCRLLATRFSHLLCKTPFVMAEMHTKRLPTRPDTIAFADSWEVRLLGGAPSVSPPSPLGAGTLPLAGAPRGPGLEAAPVPAHAADPTTTARTLRPSA